MKRWLPLIVVMSLLINPARSIAQQTNLPLVLEVSGDYFAWSQSGLQQRTNWGHNQDPILSPDGQFIAYRATAQLAVDAQKGSSAIAPLNIWVLNVATGAPTRINDQPTDASYKQTDKPDKFVMRSAPSWSPDSKALAWTELLVDKSSAQVPTQQLVVYDIAQQTQKVIVAALPANATTPYKIAWGDPGIAVWTTLKARDSSGTLQSTDTLVLYSPDGKLLLTVNISALYEFAWIKDGLKDYIAILAQGPANAPLSDPQWLLVDPGSGQISGMPGVPEMYSLLAPSGLSLYPASGTLPDWQIEGIGKLGNVDDVYVFSHVLGISPDGQQLAYVKQGAAYVYNNGKTTKIAPSDVYGLVWGPIGWRLRHSGPGQ